jgi:heme/copper-type cytochrome/quinol oxidase subunit 3
MHWAARQAQRGHFPRLRTWLVRTWVLSAAFIAIQAPCLVQLLRAHQADLLENSPGLYGMAFALIAIHALHVLGGMVPLTLLTYKALRRRLDSEHLLSVRSCAAYWHFLEGVWAVLFGMFLLTA